MCMIPEYAPLVKRSEQIQPNRPRLKATLISEGWSRRLQFNAQISSTLKLSRNDAVLRARGRRTAPWEAQSQRGRQSGARGVALKHAAHGQQFDRSLRDRLCGLPHLGMAQRLVAAIGDEDERAVCSRDSALFEAKCPNSRDKLHQTMHIAYPWRIVDPRRQRELRTAGSIEIRAAPPLGTAGPTSRIATRLNLGHTSLPERLVAKGLPAPRLPRSQDAKWPPLRSDGHLCVSG
jgi:hypothetical protein